MFGILIRFDHIRRYSFIMLTHSRYGMGSMDPLDTHRSVYHGRILREWR